MRSKPTLRFPFRLRGSPTSAHPVPPPGWDRIKLSDSVGADAFGTALRFGAPSLLVRIPRSTGRDHKAWVRHSDRRGRSRRVEVSSAPGTEAEPGHWGTSDPTGTVRACSWQPAHGCSGFTDGLAQVPRNERDAHGSAEEVRVFLCGDIHGTD